MKVQHARSRGALFAALLLLAGCVYTPNDFETDIATARCDCHWDCYPGSMYWGACMQTYSVRPRDYSICEFDPRQARRCVRAWKRKDCHPPCPTDDANWEWDSLEACEEVYYDCGSYTYDSGRWAP